MESDYSFSQCLDRMKESFLIAAAQGGNNQDIESLVDYGADINWKGQSGDTPLLAACRRGYVSSVQLLLAYGADVNICGNDSLYPIHVCVQRGDYEMLNVILESNVNTIMKTRDGYTALDIARMKGYDDICSRLMQPRRSIALPSLSPPNIALNTNNANTTTNVVNNSHNNLNIVDTSRQNNNELRINTSMNLNQNKISTSRLQTRIQSDIDLDNRNQLQHRSKIVIPPITDNRIESKSNGEYTILRPDVLQEQDDNSYYKRIYEKEVMERKNAEKKIVALARQHESLMKEVTELLKTMQHMQADNDQLTIDLKQYKGDKDCIQTLTFDECTALEKELKSTLDCIEQRKEYIVKFELTSNNNVSEQRLCVICQEKEKSVVLLPCRHMCLCDDCSKYDAIKDCPLCRTEILHKINVFA